MKIMKKAEFEQLMKENPQGGIVFADYVFNLGIVDGFQVTDGDFGATAVYPIEGEVFDWDWNIKESDDNDYFVVMDYYDILQTIQTLTKNLNIKKLEPYTIDESDILRAIQTLVKGLELEKKLKWE